MALLNLLQAHNSVVAWTIIATAILVIYLLSNRYQKGLSSVPGPWLRSISTIPRMWAICRTHSHKYDIELHQKYGKIVRVAPTILSVSDPASINQLYGITTKFRKSGFYSLAEVYDEGGQLFPDPFVLKDKDLHARTKRSAANAYSLNALVQMEPFLDEVTAVGLLKKLDSVAANNESCDFGELAKDFALDAVTSITFGKHFDYIERGDHLNFFKGLDIMTDYMAIFGQIPWTHGWLLKNPRLLKWFLGEDNSSAELVALSQREIEIGRKRETEEGPMTFLQRLLLNQKTNPGSPTDHEMLTHAFGNLAAGSDTTATAIRALFYHVLKTKRVFDRLVAEVRSSLAAPVSFTAANNLPYLGACIREAMRVHPSVGLILGRAVPKGGATICGHFIQEGTEVGINPAVLHHDPQLFPEPTIFRPERWLPSETDEARLKLMNRSFFAFGHGAHTCSGRHISHMEITKLVPTLLLRYDMELVDDGRAYRYKNRWFMPQTGLLIKFSRR